MCHAAFDTIAQCSVQLFSIPVHDLTQKGMRNDTSESNVIKVVLALSSLLKQAKERVEPPPRGVKCGRLDFVLRIRPVKDPGTNIALKPEILGSIWSDSLCGVFPA